jgi:hypothetical protein
LRLEFRVEMRVRTVAVITEHKAESVRIAIEKVLALRLG